MNKIEKNEDSNKRSFYFGFLIFLTTIILYFTIFFLFREKKYFFLFFLILSFLSYSSVVGYGILDQFSREKIHSLDLALYYVFIFTVNSPAFFIAHIMIECNFNLIYGEFDLLGFCYVLNLAIFAAWYYLGKSVGLTIIKLKDIKFKKDNT